MVYGCKTDFFSANSCGSVNGDSPSFWSTLWSLAGQGRRIWGKFVQMLISRRDFPANASSLQVLGQRSLLGRQAEPRLPLGAFCGDN